jgi:hypothetical protein
VINLALMVGHLGPPQRNNRARAQLVPRRLPASGIRFQWWLGFGAARSQPHQRRSWSHGRSSDYEASRHEATLLLLLGMKFDLLRLHPLNQMFDPIKDCLIRHAGRHEAVMLDLTVSSAHCSHIRCPIFKEDVLASD